MSLFVPQAVSTLPLLGGNSVRPLHGGEAAYPAMLFGIWYRELLPFARALR